MSCLPRGKCNRPTYRRPKRRLYGPADGPAAGSAGSGFDLPLAHLCQPQPGRGGRRGQGRRRGASNGIVVAADSPVTGIRELEGKSISVPIGSAAWGMLFLMARQNNIPISKFHIVNQDPMVGLVSIAMHKIDAHADFCPMSEPMEYNNAGRMIDPGTSTGVAYLHGIVVSRSFPDQSPEIAVAYVKALIAAQGWIAAGPQRAADDPAKTDDDPQGSAVPHTRAKTA